MKSVLFLLSLLATNNCFSQLDAGFTVDTLSVERQGNVDVLADIRVTVTSLNNGATPNTLTIAAGAAAPAGLFTFPVTNLTPVAGVREMVSPIFIRRGSNADNNALYIPLQLSYHNGTVAVTKNMVVKVVNPKSTAKKDDDDDGSFFSKLTFLNAYNFDFYGKLSSNYVGMFNVYEPGRDRGKRGANSKLFGIKLKKDSWKWQWGINAGVMKINYGLGDTEPSVIHRQENTLMRALDSVVPGKKYLRQWNRYTSTVTNSSWSFYCQPLVLLNSASKEKTASKIYFHTHLELLVNKLQQKTIVTTLEQDTAIFPNPLPKDVFPLRVRTGDTTTFTTPFYQGYFGAGFTFDIKLSHSANSSLFLQFTAGATSARPGFATVPRYRGDNGRTDWNGFYLVRAAFNQRLSDATKLVIAQDIRGFLPTYPPLYATFIGLNIKLDKLLELIKG